MLWVRGEPRGPHSWPKNMFLIFYIFAENIFFLVRFLRIHPVQSVVNNLAQLSGRGFPSIFHMKLFLSQLYVFYLLQNGSRAMKAYHFENVFFLNYDVCCG